MKRHFSIEGLPRYGSIAVTSSLAGQFAPESVFIYSNDAGSPATLAFHMTAVEARKMAEALIHCAQFIESEAARREQEA